MRFVVIALAVGFPIAMLLAWVYELHLKELCGRKNSIRHRRGRVSVPPDGSSTSSSSGLLLLVIAMLIVGRLPFYQQTGESSSQKSIAVLPFENLSANQENAFFH